MAAQQRIEQSGGDHPLAPQGCQRVLVDAAQRVIIALGCTDSSGDFDPLLIRWCSFNDITDWVSTDVNTAGSDLLTAGSRIITGLKTKGQDLVWTDTTLYRLVFVGGTDIYDVIPAGEVVIVGPNAAVDVDGVAYFMGFDNIYNYSGTLNLQACDVWETVFDPNFQTSLNRAQTESVVCYTYEPKTEITWLYPSIGGAVAVAFTAAISQGAIAATLAAAWTMPTGLYTVQFSDQEAQPVILTNGQTTATWGLPLTGPVTANAVLIGNDRYVTFNWDDGVWYAAPGIAPARRARRRRSAAIRTASTPDICTSMRSAPMPSKRRARRRSASTCSRSTSRWAERRANTPWAARMRALRSAARTAIFSSVPSSPIGPT